MKCSHCDSSFDPKTYNQKYCTTICYAKAKDKRYRAKYNNRVKINRPCNHCGKIIKTGGKRNKKYCDVKCAGAAKRKYLDIPSCLNSADRKLDKNLGYVRVYAPMHNEANTWGYVYEHRLIAEEKILGRKLAKNEVVHHKNGKRWDNRIVNLEVMDRSEHAKLYGQRKEDLDI